MSADLDNLARLEAAATPGPWTINRITGGDVEVHEIYSDAGSGGWRVVSEMGEIEPDSNAAFIAAARNALPALLADHARLVAELAAERDAHHATCDALALERAESDRLAVVRAALTAERDYYRTALHQVEEEVAGAIVAWLRDMAGTIIDVDAHVNLHLYADDIEAGAWRDAEARRG